MGHGQRYGGYWFRDQSGLRSQRRRRAVPPPRLEMADFSVHRPAAAAARQRPKKGHRNDYRLFPHAENAPCLRVFMSLPRFPL